MYCEPCGAERLGHAKFCAVCGSPTVQREAAAIERDLSHVRWLLSELPAWDSTAVPPSARVYVDKRYRYLEKVLVTVLAPSPDGRGSREAGGEGTKQSHRVAVGKPEAVKLQAAKVEAPKVEAPKVDVLKVEVPKVEVPKSELPKVEIPKATSKTSPHVPSSGPSDHLLPKGEGAGAGARAAAALGGSRFVEQPRVSARKPAPSEVPGALLSLPPPKPTREDRVVDEASSWHKVWKPFLNESIGWFVGAFLILSGTLYLVSDSWSQMGSTLRAAVVFGLAAGWTLGFSAWGRFLGRRESTAGAARVLKLIASAMAPLAPLAVGPAVARAPWLFVPASLGWAALSAWLVRQVEPQYDSGTGPTLPLSMAAATAMMGLASLTAPLGALLGQGALLWLNLVPVGLLIVHAGRERRTHAQRAFAFLSLGYLALLFGARLHAELTGFSLVSAHPVMDIAPTAYAPFVALAGVALVRLRAPGRAADALSVLAVALQVAALGLGLTLAAPGFFVAAAAGTWTCWTLARERLGHSHRWLYGVYAFAYFAWQSCGQLVPGVVKQLAAQLRGALGYGATASLPPSYDAAYAAVFVIAVGLWAARGFDKSSGTRRREADVLLRCTWVTALLAGALGLAAIGSDVRPALFSLPFLAVFEVWLGQKLDRAAHTRAGAALTVGTALAAAVALPAHAALVFGAGALLTALVAIPWTKAHREALGLAAALQVALAVALAVVGPATVSQVAALALAGFAALLASANLDAKGFAPTAGIFLAVPARALMVLSPHHAPLALALGALVGAALVHRKGRWTAASIPSALAACLAVLWQAGLQLAGAPVLFGAVALVAALALALGAPKNQPGSERAWRDTLALLLLGAAVVPGEGPFQSWSGLTPAVASLLAAGLALAASVWSRRGRHWRAVLLGSTSVTVAVWALALGAAQGHPELAALGLAAALVLSSRALEPLVTLPLAALASLAFSVEPQWLLGSATFFTALALARETRLGRRLAGPRRRLGWAGTVAAAFPAALLALVALEPFFHHPRPGLALMAGAAVLLVLAWVRATRAGAWMLLAAPLAVAALLPLGVDANWVLALAAVVLTRGVAQVPFVRGLLFPRRGLFARDDANERAQAFNGFTLAGVAVAGCLWLVASPAAALPLALALTFGAAGGLPVRLVTAACFAAVVPGALPFAALALVALALTARHAPRLAAAAFGTTRLSYVPQTASLLAVGMAGLHVALSAPGAALPALLFAFTLLVAGVLLGLGLLTFAGALAAVLLPPWNGHQLEPAQTAAGLTLLAALAGVLRYPPLGARLDAAVARLGKPLERGLSFWLWLAAAVGVTLAATVTSSDFALVLLLPAGLLLATPEQAESAVAAALLGALVLLRVPAPFSCALLSGTALALQLGARHGKGELAKTWSWAARGLSLAAVAPALWQLLQSSPGSLAPALVLAGTLAVAALVLGFGPLLSASALAVVVLPAFDGQGLQLGWLAPAATAGALAAALLRLPWLARGASAVQRAVGTPMRGAIASWVWVAAALAVAAGGLFAPAEHAMLLLPAGLLLFTEVPLESGFAIGLLAALLLFRVPAPLSGVLLAGIGLAFTWSSRGRPARRTQVWFHAGWMLALAALPAAVELANPLTPLAWALAAGSAWVVADTHPELEPLGWLASLAAGHVALFFLGLKLATGAPRELILPWLASLSLLTGALALALSGKGRARAFVGAGAVAFGLLELALGIWLLHGAHPREAFVACVALTLAGGTVVARGGRADERLAALLAGVLPGFALVTVHCLGLGGTVGSFEAFAALVLGAVAGGLHGPLERAKQHEAAKIALGYAFVWPLMGLLAAPHEAGWTLAGLLLAQSAHFAWVSRHSGRKLAALVSAAAFNAAMVCGWLSSGFHAGEYLVIPFGLSLLALVRVFSDELSESTRVKLRAAAVTLVYAAAAIRPLTFETPAALFVCVAVCVIGVGVGVGLKVRSYVYLGTAFLVTAVLANLVRFGVREPRAGAIFLSSLGLLVVGFMVLVTTRRAELLERFKAARAMLQQWDG